MMTAKDFMGIAMTITKEKDLTKADATLSKREQLQRRIAIERLAEGIADVCKQSNPAFDRRRFLNTAETIDAQAIAEAQERALVKPA